MGLSATFKALKKRLQNLVLDKIIHTYFKVHIKYISLQFFFSKMPNFKCKLQRHYDALNYRQMLK